MKNVNMTMRIDEELKMQAENLFEDLGMSLSTAFTIFLKQAVREQQIPFNISRNVPNSVTLEAMKQAENDENMNGPYEDIDTLMKALNA